MATKKLQLAEMNQHTKYIRQLEGNFVISYDPHKHNKSLYNTV